MKEKIREPSPLCQKSKLFIFSIETKWPRMAMRRTFNKNANIIDSRTTIESLKVDLILQQIAKTNIDKSEMPIWGLAEQPSPTSIAKDGSEKVMPSTDIGLSLMKDSIVAALEAVSSLRNTPTNVLSESNGITRAIAYPKVNKLNNLMNSRLFFLLTRGYQLRHISG